jgi:glycosyltransferase involved in cell wall biosynthesis
VIGAGGDHGGTGNAVDVSISLVISAHNEAANLPHVLTRIPDIVDEVLLVDGHSVDDTVSVAQAILPEIRVLQQPGSGRGTALACGCAAATGDIIVMLDADGLTDPAEIPHFVGALIDGSDFAKGSRYLTGGRTAGNRLLNAAVNVLFRTRYTDLCYGYNAFWRRCLPDLRITVSGFELETLMPIRVARAGLRVTEVPSVEYARIFAESKRKVVREGLRVLSVIVRERLRPHRRHLARWDSSQPSFDELTSPAGSETPDPGRDVLFESDGA